jgi:hypothetical protein
MAKKAEKIKKDPSGLLIPAGLFIGMGVGFLIDKFVASLFIGLGAGFLLVAILQMSKYYKKKK